MTSVAQRRPHGLALFIMLGSMVGGTIHAEPSAAGLVEAAQARDLPAVRRLLQSGVDVNAPSRDGTTAVHWAAQHDDGAMTALLLGAGANARAANRYGMTPLWLASANGSAHVVRLLLDAGADATQAMPEGDTVLMTASRSGNADVVRMLLANGANPNAREAWKGQTALMWAAAEGHAPVIEALVAAGADVTVRTIGKPRPRGASDADVTHVAGFTAFLFAARAGHIEAVRALLRRGAQVDETLHDGTGALILAIASAHYDVAAFLLDQGANPNPDTPGWSPLHQLVMGHSPATGHNNPYPVPHGAMSAVELVKKLVVAGADINARLGKEPERVLIGRRGNPNTSVGGTPFFIAAKAADVELMHVLLALGADPGVPNAHGTTPLMAAAGVGIFEVGESPGSNESSLAAVQICLALGSDVNVIDASRETALHGAAYRGTPAVVRLLVEAGARLDVQNMRGWSAWRIANGVEIGIIFHREPETATLLQRYMVERGQWLNEDRDLTLNDGATRAR